MGRLPGRGLASISSKYRVDIRECQAPSVEKEGKTPGTGSHATMSRDIPLSGIFQQRAAPGRLVVLRQSFFSMPTRKAVGMAIVLIFPEAVNISPVPRE